MFIAKMVTRYPDFHGKGHYNLLVSNDWDELLDKIQDNIHDFSHVKTVEAEGIKDIDELLAEYPTKEELNKELFGE